MLLSSGIFLAGVCLLQRSLASPTNHNLYRGLSFPELAEQDVEKRYDGFPDNLADRLGQYIAPGPDDSRGPCPALNTLANHGLINRNGKNISSDDVKVAMPRGFGIREDGFDQALHNWEVVCEYVLGVTCEVPEKNGTFILRNLTLLGEPHAFEHDHSFSRQDYKQNYAGGLITDNIYFNESEFRSSLDVVGYQQTNPPTKATANYQQFNQIRLQRQSLQNQADYPGFFQINNPVQLTEVGFIFGATFDRDSNGEMLEKIPRARLDWWNFWFQEESFPTHLGWVPAHESVFNFPFITSVSSAVIAQSITSTPTKLPPGALAKTASSATDLPEPDPSPLLPLFQGPPYAAHTAPSNIKSEAAKRDATPTGILPLPTGLLPSVISEVNSVITAAPQIVDSALAIVGPAPTPYNFYQQYLDISSLQAQIAQAQSYESAVIAAITSLVDEL